MCVKLKEYLSVSFWNVSFRYILDVWFFSINLQNETPSIQTKTKLNEYSYVYKLCISTKISWFDSREKNCCWWSKWLEKTVPTLGVIAVFKKIEKSFISVSLKSIFLLIGMCKMKYFECSSLFFQLILKYCQQKHLEHLSSWPKM